MQNKKVNTYGELNEHVCVCVCAFNLYLGIFHINRAICIRYTLYKECYVVFNTRWYEHI